jgi:hypothetical protein
MLDAVYIDLLATRSIVGLLPKPPFYSLFESLRQRSDSKLIFNPEQLRNVASQGEIEDLKDEFGARDRGFGGGGGELNSAVPKEFSAFYANEES